MKRDPTPPSGAQPFYTRASLREAMQQGTLQVIAPDSAPAEYVPPAPVQPRQQPTARLLEPPEDGMVVSFTKTFGGPTVYSYVAVRTPQGWAVSGQQGLQTWAGLLSFADRNETGPVEVWAAQEFVEVEAR